MTTAAFLARWLEHQKGRLRPHPYKRYGQIVRDHVLPVIGDLRIDRVRPAHVQRVLDEVAAKGLAVRSVVETRVVLSSAMRQAAAWGLIVANPVTAVRPPKGERKELAVPSAAQLVALLKVARGSTWEIPLVLATTTGARRSECWRPAGPTSTSTAPGSVLPGACNGRRPATTARRPFGSWSRKPTGLAEKWH